MKRTRIIAAAAIALAAAQCPAQTNLVTNPSFEQDDPTNATAPLGWLDFNQSTTASTAFAHSGSRSLRMVFGNSNFAGSTTNYFDPNNFTYPYDPVITFLGGPITVSGWYLIPADHPVAGTSWASLKLQVRRTVNNSSYQDFEWANAITGHTNGQWVYFERTITNNDFQTWPLPPTPGQPTRCSVLPIMFDPNGINPTPEIYWDDIRLVQSTACYANCDNSTGSPVLNVNDFVCFQSRFAAADPYADCNHDSALNVNDFVCFQSAFAAGCP
jgi:hypothetical protein